MIKTMLTDGDHAVHKALKVRLLDDVSLILKCTTT